MTLLVPYAPSFPLGRIPIHRQRAFNRYVTLPSFSRLGQPVEWYYLNPWRGPSGIKKTLFLEMCVIYEPHPGAVNLTPVEVNW